MVIEIKEVGFLRRCIDRRFGHNTRLAFEKATGLGPDDYYDEAIAGGAAVDTDPAGLNYAANHKGAIVFGWMAHGDGCGGQPDINDAEIQARLDSRITELMVEYSGTHFRIFATENGIEIRKV